MLRKVVKAEVLNVNAYEKDKMMRRTRTLRRLNLFKLMNIEKICVRIRNINYRSCVEYEKKIEDERS